MLSSPETVIAQHLGRFTAILYGVNGAAAMAWHLTAGRSFDPTILFIVGSSLGGAIVFPLLPWERHGPVLLRVSAVMGGVLLAALMPIMVAHAPLLVFPAMGAALYGSVLPWPWMVGVIAPSGVAYAIVLPTPPAGRNASWSAGPSWRPSSASG